RREAALLDALVERVQSFLDRVCELFIRKPASAECVVLAAVVEIVTDRQKEKDVGAVGGIFGKVFEKNFLPDASAKAFHCLFELVEAVRMTFVGLRFAHYHDAVVFYLADAFAGDVVFLADSVERALFAFTGEAKAVYEHAAGTLRELREKFFAD